MQKDELNEFNQQEDVALSNLAATRDIDSAIWVKHEDAWGKLSKDAQTYILC